MRSRRRKPLNPVDERRRRIVIQTMGLSLLVLIAAVLVYKALQVP